MSISRKTIRLFGFTCFLILSVSCHNYYKATTARTENATVTAASIDSISPIKRYFILRSGNLSWHMTNIKLSEDRKSLSCSLDSVSYKHQLHFSLGMRRVMQYQKNKPEHMGVTNEVHMFIPRDSAILPGTYTLALDKVQKIEVLEHDKKRTAGSYVIGAIGYTLGAAVVVGIIVAATKSSCPFVSAYDGNQFTLQGEIYGGSIYPQLARHDFIPLQMAPLPDGTLQVKISNELKERQYTDIADLLVITHSHKTKILADEKGKLYSISDPQPPIQVALGNKNLLSSVRHAGDNEILYMDDSSNADARNEVVLKFRTEPQASQGKLLLNLKNSYWLDLLYGELAKGFGTYYAAYMNEQKSKPAAELLKWVKEQQIPLEVSVKTSAGWKKITDITTIGPLAFREIVVPVELNIQEPFTEIKLSSGFMFWEIDQVAMDYTTDNNFTVQSLSPVEAQDELGHDVLPQLAKEDGRFLEQPEIGNVATLTYPSIPAKDPMRKQTFILHAKGYYEHIRDFQHKPDLKFLYQFRQPNAFPVYGMTLYKKISEESLAALTHKN